MSSYSAIDFYVAASGQTFRIPLPGRVGSLAFEREGLFEQIARELLTRSCKELLEAVLSRMSLEELQDLVRSLK